MPTLTEKEFFDSLLEKTKTAFGNSLTKKKYPGEKWGCAVCDTPIQKGKGIIFGINWGNAAKTEQTAYPKSDKRFKGNKFISSSEKYIREFLKSEVKDLNYSNLCFFRTPFANNLPDEDWKLAIPLFMEYVAYINPPWMLMLGKPNKLSLHAQVEKVKAMSRKTNKAAYGYYGSAFGNIPFVSVPHPQAWLSMEVRTELWRKVIIENKYFPK